MSISAVIFDLDGTVLTDEDEYGKAFKKVLSGLGVKVVSDFPHRGGIGVEENWRYLLEKYKIKTNKTVQELGKETQKEYLKLLGEVELKEGFEDFIKDLKKSGITTALATSNSWYVVERIFVALPIEEYFDSITTGEEVKEKKPSPDIFLKAADKINTDPENCVVFEDSEAGIKAAQEAGMKVVGIARDEVHAKELKKADLVVYDYKQFFAKQGAF
jgi:HAD superfamily hydrolase (TIGR01509 family)